MLSCFEKNNCIYTVFCCLIVLGCSTKDSETNKKLDLTKFSTNEYEKRIKEFIKEDVPNLDERLDVYFFNSEGCSSCMKSSVMQIFPAIERTKTKTIIYYNDSLLFNNKINNPKVEFIQKPLRVFKEKSVAHFEPYLYIIDSEVVSIKLNYTTIDSLLKN